MNLSKYINNKLHLRPTIAIKKGKGKNSTSVRCLLDRGSQLSYFSNGVLDKLNISIENQQCTKCNIKPYLGVSICSLIKGDYIYVYTDQLDK